jgi:hypothetical protein
MSNEISIFSNDLPAEQRAQEGLSDLAKSMVGTRNVYINRRIVVKKGTFRKLLNGEEAGGKLEGPLNVIIVNALPGISRQYYAADFDSDAEKTLPDCWSNLGDKPEQGATNPQAAGCSSCPQNVDGPKGRACKFQRRIAVMLEGDQSGDVYQMNLGSKSIFGKGEGRLYPFEAYFQFLLANNESIDRVVTSISIDDNVDYAKVFFSAARHLNADELELARQASAKPDVKNLVRLTVAAADGVKKLPSAAVEAAPAPAPSDEPTKRASSKPTVPPVQDQKLSDVVSAWSDE